MIRKDRSGGENGKKKDEGMRRNIWKGTATRKERIKKKGR
jgi:hypothetical protein